MRPYSSAAVAKPRGTPWMASLLLLCLLALASARPARADTQLTIVNPQPNETISTKVQVDTKGAGNPADFMANYLINGTCHNADKVSLTISGASYSISGTAVVKGNVWEFSWVFPNGLEVGTPVVTITATPSANGVTPPGAAQFVTVNMTHTDPGGALSLLPSSVVSHLYIGTGAGAAPGQTLTLGLQVRFFSGVASPFTRILHLNDGFSPHRSNTKTSTIQIQDASGTALFNNDDPNGMSLPISFTLGNGAGGLIDGLNTIVMDYKDVPTFYQRSLIVDYTPPNVVTSLNGPNQINFPAKDLVQFTGVVNDPDNGLTAPAVRAPGGVASVELIVQPPTGPVERIPAHLTYGANPSDNVTWKVDYKTDTKPAGNYQVYAVVTDNAGNITYDPGGNAPAPLTVGIDQADAPTVSVTPPANPFLAGSQTIHFSATANAIVGANTDLAWELHNVVGGVDTLIAKGTGHGALSANWDTTKAPDGPQSLYLLATDLQENSATSATVAVTVDNTRPTPAFTAPAAGTFVRGNAVTVSGTIKDNIVDPNNIITVTLTDNLNNTIALTPSSHSSDSAGGFNVSGTYDTTTVSDGTRTLTLSATDKAGNTGTATLSIVVDNTPPTVSLTSPADNSAFGSGKLVVAGTISDNIADPNNIVSWKLMDGATTVDSGKGSAPFPFSFSGVFDTTSASEGVHTLTVLATDRAGNTSSPAVVHVNVDKTPPVATITQVSRVGGPAYTLGAGKVVEIVRDTLTISGTFVETNLKALTVQVDGKPVATSVDTNAKTFTATWNTTSPLNGGDGTHMLTVAASDTAGNQNDPTTTNVSVVVDNAPPVVGILSPANNSTAIVGDTVAGFVTDTYPNPVAVFTFTNTATNASVSLPATLVNGVALGAIPAVIGGQSTVGATLAITITGTDLATPPHTTTSTPILVTVAAPVVAIDQISHPDFSGSQRLDGPPLPATVYVRAGMNVLGRVGVANLQTWTLTISRPGSPTILIGSDGPNPAAEAFVTICKLNKSPNDPFDTTRLTDNAYTLTLKATDQSNNMTTVTQTVVVDNTAPIVAFGPNTPSANSVVQNQGGSLVTIDGAITEANLDSWQILIDGVVQATGNTNAVSFTPGASAAYFGEGPHTLQIVALDKAGNRGATEVRTITIDNTKPAITISSPSNGAFLRGSVVIGAAITDANPKSWTLTDNASTLASDNTGSTSVNFTWDTTKVGDGSHKLTVNATDKAGNTNSANVTVTVDNTPPKVMFGPMTPPNGAFVRSPVTIDGAITEANLDHWQILVDNAVLQQGTTPTILFTADQATIPDGRHSVQIVTVDKAGNTGSTEVRSLTVDNQPPVVVITRPLDNATVAIGDSVIGSVTEINPASAVYTFTNVAPGGKTATRTPANINVPQVPVPATYDDNSPITPDTTLLVTLTATDKAGNVGSASIHITIGVPNPVHIDTLTYNTAPVGPVNTVSGVYYVRGSIAVAGTVNLPNIDPAKGWTLNISDSTRTTQKTIAQNKTQSPNTMPLANWDTTTLNITGDTGAVPDQLILTATDLAGEQFTDVKSVVIDNTPPKTALTATPVANGKYVHNTITLQGAITEAHPGAAKIVYRMSGGTYQDLPGATGSGSALSFNWDTTRFPDGNYDLAVVATDLAGNANDPNDPNHTTKLTLVVDNTNPVPVFTRPAAGEFDRLAVQIAGNITEVNLQSWKLQLDGQDISAIPGVPNPAQSQGTGNVFSYTLTTATVDAKGNVTRIVPDGKHTITVVATDLAGNQGTASRDVIVDNTPPTSFITTPQDLAYVGGTSVAIAASIQDNILDPNNAIASWAIQVTPASDQFAPVGNPVTLKASAGSSANPFVATATWNTESGAFPNGNYLLTVTTTDKAGNTQTSLPTRVTVVNGNPTATLNVVSPASLFDQYGAVTTNLGQTVYGHGSQFFLTNAVTNSSQVVFTEIFNGGASTIQSLALRGADTQSKKGELHDNREGRYQIQETATNVTIPNTVASQVDLVLDNAKPLVTFNAPGGSYVAVPTSVVSVVFRVGKPGKDPRFLAPIQRILLGANKPLNAPQITLKIYDAGVNQQVPFTWDLKTAVQSPNLSSTNGAATVTGDAFNGFTVIWQIPVDPKVFSVNRKYRLELTGASDVTGNPQDPASQNTAFLTINVN